MQIIIGNTRIVAGPVTKWLDIQSDAYAMADMIDTGNFKGLHKDTFALAHSQVSYDPKAFFVLSKMASKGFQGHRIIANAKIIKKSSPMTSQEACMSFQHRTKKNVRRYDKITIECEIPPFRIIPPFEMRHITLELEGLEAYIVQHELDHLKGIDIYNK